MLLRSGAAGTRERLCVMIAWPAVPGHHSKGQFSSPRFYILVIKPLFVLVIQTFVPSKATPLGPAGTANVPITKPSLARSLVTLLPVWFATQMLVPSNATPVGFEPTGSVPSSVASRACTLLTLL